MSKSILIVLILSFVSVPTFAKSGKHGGGIVIGEVLDLSYKFMWKRRAEFDGHIGVNDDETHIRARYLYLHPGFFDFKRGKGLDAYWGPGVAVKRHKFKRDGEDVTQTLLGVHVPGGVRFLFKDPTVEIFSELTANSFRMIKTFALLQK